MAPTDARQRIMRASLGRDLPPMANSGQVETLTVVQDGPSERQVKMS
jgi:hypothetical protein